MLAEKPWKLEAVARLFLAIITTLFLGGVLAGLFGHFTASWPKAQTEFWQMVISALFLEVPALAWIALFLRQQDLTWKDAFGLQVTNPMTAAAYGMLGGALFVPVAWGLEALSGYLMELVHWKAEDQLIVQQLQDPNLALPAKVLMGVIAVLLAPVVEELIFRGILYPTLKKLGRPPVALWVSSTLFALVHCNMETFVPLLVFALLLVYLYETFQNLLAPMAAHSVFNAANFLALIFRDQIEHGLHLT